MDSRRPKVNLILDASVALAWHVTRSQPSEALVAQQVLQTTMIYGASVPHLWYPEVVNGLVVAERQGASTAQDSRSFLADLDSLPIAPDAASTHSLQSKVLALARTYQLTAYDVTYLELALRTASTLATFDKQLAGAARSAGVPIFGSQP